ncbi:MAG: NAD(P)-binding domain-containing protein [Prevotellaceae bacterium]|jgi:lactate dehydrogenase-like 2-hydroxyacid dehydrogenase|nr:NAD(P)-binding domain-containing protein [Prevotellaceae bacterium]
MRKKVLITYNLFREGFVELEKEFDLIFPPEKVFTQEELSMQIGDCDALLPMFNLTVNRKLIDAGKKLKIIANYGVGYNNIDVGYATQKGIAVTNTPDPVIEPTAELAFSLMAAVARRIPECDRKLREGAIKWGVLENLGTGLYGKTLGIIGMGRIGQAIARRAVASGMKVTYHNRNRLDAQTEQRYDSTYLSFNDLLQTSDYISLNMPLTEDTFHLIGENELNRMKKSAILINTARGAVIDEKALVRSLASGHLGGAGLDVYEHEPDITPQLLTMDNVVLSPHNGTATIDGRNAMSRYAAENITRFFRGEKLLSRIN